MPDHQRSTTTATATSTSTGGAASTGATRDAQSTVGNSAVADSLKSGKKPQYTGIVHFGLNGGAETEAGLLDKLNADKGGAKSIRNQKEQDVLVRNKQRMDLATDEGREAWLGTLGFGPEIAEKVGGVIRDAGAGARDELGQLIEVYAQAESGVRRMDRLVLSGHNVGSAMWGDDNGRVPFETFVSLREIFPTAAAQVRHLLVSACYSGGENQMETYKEAFPSLSSIMAYTGSSPGTYSGGTNHITRWEKATEKGDGSNVDKDIAKNTRKGENVSTWNQKDGYQGDQPTSWWDVDRDLSAGDDTFARYYEQGQEVTDAQNGELRAYYNLLQRALRHAELPDSRRPELEERRDKTIRLLFYNLIRGKFTAQYAGDIAAGYKEAAGLAQPDFAKLTRADALAAIEALAGAASGSAAAKALDLLRRGLQKLENEVVPEVWI